MLSVDDIGRLSAQAFLNEKNEHTEQYMVGPELLTLDQVRPWIVYHLRLPQLTGLLSGCRYLE